MNINSLYMQCFFRIIFRQGKLAQKLSKQEDWDLIKIALYQYYKKILRIYKEKGKFIRFIDIKDKMIKLANREVAVLKELESGFSLSFCE